MRELPYTYNPRLPQKKPGTARGDLKKLRSHHREILRLHRAGLTNKEIAEHMGCSPDNVSKTLNSNEGSVLLQAMEADADRHAEEMDKEKRRLAAMALTVHRDIFENETAPLSLKLDAAKDILGRAGHVAPKNVNVNQNHNKLSNADIEFLKSRARQAQIVEVPAEEIVSEVVQDVSSEA
jgi:predicted transcriptional regulator